MILDDNICAARIDRYVFTVYNFNVLYVFALESYICGVNYLHILYACHIRVKVEGGA